MTDLVRYGSGSFGAGGKELPFADAVEADGWLYVSGQVAMVGGEIIAGGIVEQATQTFANIRAILERAGYGFDDVVRVGVWLDDPRDFWSFNKVFRDVFGGAPPARACVRSSMMVDCKIEIDCVAFRADRKPAR